MSRTKKAEIEIDLHPCPGKTVNGVKRYIESNLRRDPSIPLCILHVGTNDCSTRDRSRKTQGLCKIYGWTKYDCNNFHDRDQNLVTKYACNLDCKGDHIRLQS